MKELLPNEHESPIPMNPIAPLPPDLQQLLKETERVVNDPKMQEKLAKAIRAGMKRADETNRKFMASAGYRVNAAGQTVMTDEFYHKLQTLRFTI